MSRAIFLAAPTREFPGAPRGSFTAPNSPDIHVGLCSWRVAGTIQSVPIRASHPVQDMPPQRMPRLHVRVIEIVCRVARHADAFHDTPRALVQWHGERDDFFKCQL